MQPLSYGETIETTTDEHATVLKDLENLTGIEGFPGCEVMPDIVTAFLLVAHISDFVLGVGNSSYSDTRGRRSLQAQELLDQSIFSHLESTRVRKLCLASL